MESYGFTKNIQMNGMIIVLEQQNLKHMKKIVLLLCFTGLISQQAQAQMQTPTFKNDVYVGVGVLGTNAIIDVFANILVTGITAGTYTSDASFSPIYNAGYKRSLGKRTAIGAAYSFAYSRSNALINKEKTGEFRNNYHNIAVGFDYKWLLRHRFTMYSSAEAGITIFDQKYVPNEGKSSADQTVYFNFQISPIGLKYGYRYGPFAELGFGYKGIVNAGMFASF